LQLDPGRLATLASLPFLLLEAPYVKTTLACLLLFFCLNVGIGQSQEPAAGNAPVKADTLTLPPGKATPKEDWSSPSLKNSHLKITEVLNGGADESTTYTSEMIQITWRAGDPIYLFVILPKDHPKPPVILYLYTYPEDTDRFMNDDFCGFLAKGGYAAVGFVSALTGQRYHDRPMKEWFVSELQEAVGSTVHDVQMVLNYLTKRGDVDMTRVGMFGEGSGAAVAIMAAAVDPRIKVLDLADPWGDWPDWLAKSTLVPENERAGFVKPEFLKRTAPVDPVAWFGKVTIPVRLQYVGEPGITPLVAQERILSAAPPQAKIIPHKDALAQFQTAKLKFFDWIKDQLRQDTR